MQKKGCFEYFLLTPTRREWFLLQLTGESCCALTCSPASCITASSAGCCRNRAPHFRPVNDTEMRSLRPVDGSNFCSVDGTSLRRGQSDLGSSNDFESYKVPLWRKMGSSGKHSPVGRWEIHLTRRTAVLAACVLTHHIVPIGTDIVCTNIDKSGINLRMYKHRQMQGMHKQRQVRDSCGSVTCCMFLLRNGSRAADRLRLQLPRLRI